MLCVDRCVGGGRVATLCFSLLYTKALAPLSPIGDPSPLSSHYPCIDLKADSHALFCGQCISKSGLCFTECAGVMMVSLVGGDRSVRFQAERWRHISGPLPLLLRGRALGQENGPQEPAFCSKSRSICFDWGHAVDPDCLPEVGAIPPMTRRQCRQ